MNQNIQIGDYLLDSDGYCCKVIDIHKTNLGQSVRIYQLRRTSHGINTSQWHWVDKFFLTRFNTNIIGIEGYLKWLSKASTKDIETYYRSQKLLKDI